MDILTFNKVEVDDNAIEEIKNALKTTKNVRFYKIYSILKALLTVK